ncbi:DUF982 domain-containing protein [Rhizobium halophytocola]|uniref:DUF982 domain-containing protein n=1 Tax=Rhizobium halophytocola TaxID=735519 RepID=A0ABS4E2H2_9HYPH|nr:DUF982 domain-containing protein [Rhizobium halophytocola]MBP1852136.1 hypothetical protein [Rhizobium halophytocola]
MAIPRWNAPVDVGVDPLAKRTISSPLEALAFLTEEWPGPHDDAYGAALLACNAAVAGTLDAGTARTEFNKALDRHPDILPKIG